MSNLIWGATNVLQVLSSIFVHTNADENLGCGGCPGNAMNSVDENRVPDLLRTYEHDRRPIKAALAPPFAPPLPPEGFAPTAARVTYVGDCRKRYQKGAGRKHRVRITTGRVMQRRSR